MAFTEPQIRRALIGFCGANQNAFLHYLAFAAAMENEAARTGSEGLTGPTIDYLTEFRAEIVQWLDNGPAVNVDEE